MFKTIVHAWVCMKIAGPNLALQTVHICFWIVHSEPCTSEEWCWKAVREDFSLQNSLYKAAGTTKMET